MKGLRAGFYSKLPSQVARIAIILHCLKRADDPRVMLDADTMTDAISVGEYFREHLNRVLPLIGDDSIGGPVGLAARILRYLRSLSRHDADGWVRRDALYNRLRNVSADALSDELQSLENQGAVESRSVPTATKPSEQWRIRPSPSTYNSGFSDYSSSQAENPNSTNCANGHSPDVDISPEAVWDDTANFVGARR